MSLRSVCSGILLGILVSGASPALADKNSELRPLISRAVELTYRDTFSETGLTSTWEARKGDWVASDGVVTGKERPSDRHTAILLLKKPNRNSIVRVSFRFEGAQAFAFQLRRMTGHLLRVHIHTDGIAIQKDRDKRLPDILSEQLAQAKGSFEQQTWYTLLIEVKGDQIAAQTDNGLRVTARHSSFDIDKPDYRFMLSGEALQLDDIAVWSIEE